MRFFHAFLRLNIYSWYGIFFAFLSLLIYIHIFILPDGFLHTSVFFPCRRRRSSFFSFYLKMSKFNVTKCE